MEFTTIQGGPCTPKGFLGAGIHCGIRKNKQKRDLALLYSPTPCTAASVYTQNKVKGAPIHVTQANLTNGKAQAILCNSGNANTCNADGIPKAEAMCQAVGEALGISPKDVIVASTGVIGQPLPLQPILDGMDKLVQCLERSSSDAAEAITTTDTYKKEAAVQLMLGGQLCTIGGMAKGSGMIHPNMATMLCFLTTDVAISPPMLHNALLDCVKDSFNMVSVDGDTSTNDMVSILANGQAGNPTICDAGAEYDCFQAALAQICTQLCKEVARDGEGATKLLECTVIGADSTDVARTVAKSVITSSLFKAAMFGQDANWGRILCAIGYADAEFDIHKVAVTLSSDQGAIQVCQGGMGLDFCEEQAAAILQSSEITVAVTLGDGHCTATAWGCDLTYDYVKINGDYRT